MRRAAVVLLLAVAAQAQAGGVAEIRRNLIADLEELVEWCTKSSLLRSRNAIYEAILQVEPDHEKARYWLRYERRGNKWVRPNPYRAPQDKNPDAMGEFAKRRAAVLANLEERLSPVIEEKGPERAGAIALMLAVDPANKMARAANGEVQWRGHWVLEETTRAFARRAELQRIAGTALRAVPAPQPTAITEEERALGLPWTCAFQGQWWRVVATVEDKEEVRLSLRAADAAAAFVAGAIADETRPMTPEGMSVWNFGFYLLTQHAEGIRFMARHASYTDAERKFAQSLAGSWVPKSNCQAQWRDTPESRRDGMCRTAIGSVLRERYGRMEKGWLIEGFGLYFTQCLVGTRLTYLVAQTQYARNEDDQRKLDLIGRMHQGDANWLDLARRLGQPDLRFLASKGLNEMTSEDVLWSYTLAAYLIEGRPDGLSEFLALSSEKSLDEALAQAYGMTVPDLEKRLLRWLGEVR